MASITENVIPGGWCDREILIGPHRFRLWTPADPDELLTVLETPEATEQPHLADPYWAKLWPAAPLLAGAIVRHPPPKGTHVLELGCGSGLVGITALACGLDLTFSDYVPFTIELALENAARNGFENARSLILDWHRPVDWPGCEFALIVGADVTYDRTNLDALLNVLEKLLAPIGEAWFGDAGRSPAEDFVARARSRGWSVLLFDENDNPKPECQLGHYRRIVLKKSPESPARRK